MALSHLVRRLWSEEGEGADQYLGRECETQNKLMTSLSFNFPIAGQFILNGDLISKFLLLRARSEEDGQSGRMMEQYSHYHL